VDRNLIEYHQDGHIVEVVLNRPEKLNALTAAMGASFRAHLERFDRDPDAWVAVIRGAGRAFCSGADVLERQIAGVEGIRSPDYLMRLASWKPIVAAVHGFAVGGGLQIALGCDLIVCAEGTRFQVTETVRGLNSVALWTALTMRVGETFANDVCLTGRVWDAEEARQLGMINSVTKGDVRVAAMELAQLVAQNPPLAVREVVKRRRFEFEKLDLESRLAAPRHLRQSDDFREAATAFVEKRPPKPFKGR